MHTSNFSFCVSDPLFPHTFYVLLFRLKKRFSRSVSVLSQAHLQAKNFAKRILHFFSLSLPLQISAPLFKHASTSFACPQQLKLGPYILSPLWIYHLVFVVPSDFFRNFFCAAHDECNWLGIRQSFQKIIKICLQPSQICIYCCINMFVVVLICTFHLIQTLSNFVFLRNITHICTKPLAPKTEGQTSLSYVCARQVLLHF